MWADALVEKAFTGLALFANAARALFALFTPFALFIPFAFLVLFALFLTRFGAFALLYAASLLGLAAIFAVRALASLAGRDPLKIAQIKGRGGAVRVGSRVAHRRRAERKALAKQYGSSAALDQLGIIALALGRTFRSAFGLKFSCFDGQTVEGNE